MKYKLFEDAFSKPRMASYLSAVNGNEINASQLYELNLKLSAQCLIRVSFIEVSLRNRIDRYFLNSIGPNWLLEISKTNGLLRDAYEVSERINFKIALMALDEKKRTLNRTGGYKHDDLIASLDFGFWRHIFNDELSNLLKVKSSVIFPLSDGINNRNIFHKLKEINNFRNRIAHHEPICISWNRENNRYFINPGYSKNQLASIEEVIRWLGIEYSELESSFQEIDEIYKAIEIIRF